MEKHPIELWDHLICISLYPANVKNACLDNRKLESFREEAKKAREQMRSYLIRESLSRRNEDEIRILVEQHQFFLTRLIDTLSDYQAANDNSFELQKIYEEVAIDLESIIQFLEAYFSFYFKKNAEVPRFILSRFEKKIRHQLTRIKKRFAEQEKDQRLIESVFESIDHLLQSSGPKRTSFYQLDFLRNLVIYFSKWDIEHYKNSKIPPLVLMLISLKFNEASFLFHVFRMFRDEIAALDSEEEQLMLWKEYYKIVSQVVEITDKALFNEKPSPKEIILDWLGQELYFLETRYPKKENTSAITPTAKINTSLSVPVLALYFRLFKEAGIVTNSNYQELFRAISSTFTTHRQADVAHSHLHSKFYAIEESAKRKVFDQLMQMAHLCKRIA